MSGRLDRRVRDLLQAADVNASNRDARALVEAGRVRVQGRVVRRSSHRIDDDTPVRIDGDLSGLQRALAPDPPLDLEALIRFADEDLLVVDKPPHVPSDRTRDPRRDSMIAAAERWAGSRCRPTLAHRLDLETSGTLVFALSARARAALTDAFRDRTVRKTYVALVYTTEAPAGRAWVERGAVAERQPGRWAVVLSGGADAETAFELTAGTGPERRVIAHPRTGRTHQIRAHLAHVGLPIAGDIAYGGAVAEAGRVMLHAREIVVPVPWAQTQVVVSCPVPF